MVCTDNNTHSTYIQADEQHEGNHCEYTQNAVSVSDTQIEDEADGMDVTSHRDTSS